MPSLDFIQDEGKLLVADVYPQSVLGRFESASRCIEVFAQVEIETVTRPRNGFLLRRSTDEYPLTGYISGTSALPYIILSGVSFEEANAVEGR